MRAQDFDAFYEARRDGGEAPRVALLLLVLQEAG